MRLWNAEEFADGRDGGIDSINGDSQITHKTPTDMYTTKQQVSRLPDG